MRVWFHRWFDKKEPEEHKEDRSLHFPSSMAVLCQDCNEVSNANHACPACGSRALFNLANVLSREEGQVFPQEYQSRPSLVC